MLKRHARIWFICSALMGLGVTACQSDEGAPETTDGAPSDGKDGKKDAPAGSVETADLLSPGFDSTGTESGPDGVAPDRFGLDADGAPSQLDGPIGEPPADAPVGVDGGRSTTADAASTMDSAGAISTDAPMEAADAPDADARRELDGDLLDGAVDTDRSEGPGGPVRLTPAVIDFGAVAVGAISTPQTVLISIVRDTVALSPAVSGAGFSISGSTCLPSQGPGTTCTLNVAFAPVFAGAASGVLYIGGATVTLSGQGSVPGTFTATDRIDLGTLRVDVATPAVVQIVPQGSVQGLTCTASSPDLTFDSSTCPATGAISVPCTFTFSFRAVTAGAKSGSVVCNGAGKTTVTTISATIVTGPSIVVSPTTLAFVAVVGESSTATISAGNAGGSASGPLTVALAAGALDFSVVANECVVPLAPLSVCKVQIAFRPTSAGVKSGTLTVADSASSSAPVSISLTGTSVTAAAVTMSPSSASFGTVSLGVEKDTLFTLHNTGGNATETLEVSSSAAEFVVAQDLCSGVPLAPDGTCTFFVAFTPLTGGAKSAVIAVSQGGTVLANAQVSGVGL
jgi:trimeric autotransporter adhesin